jgi:hypothetical protein
MLEHEIQKLTAAIVELIATMREHAKPPAQAQAPEPTPASAPAPEPTPAPEPAPTAAPEPTTPGVTRDGLKEISLQIVRADTAKKKDIVAILEAHGAQTITKLADAHILAVHGQFLALSQQVMKEARR